MAREASAGPAKAKDEVEDALADTGSATAGGRGMTIVGVIGLGALLCVIGGVGAEVLAPLG